MLSPGDLTGISAGGTQFASIVSSSCDDSRQAVGSEATGADQAVLVTQDT